MVTSRDFSALRAKIGAIAHVQSAVKAEALDDLLNEIRTMLAAEREACATLCDVERGPVAARIAEAIRSRPRIPKVRWTGRLR